MKETTFEEQSSLKIYSLGIVTKGAGKTLGEIMVTPIEAMNIQKPGLIDKNKIEFKGSHPDDKGVSVDGNVKAENFVKATWICIGTSNRVTPPIVYPNETVLLYRYSNNDVFYWTSIFHEADLRKKESAIFGFSNLSVAKGWKDGAPVAYGKDTGYWVEIDAIKKLVSLTTPNNDGEFAKYVFEIDVAKATLTISDDKKNIIKIDSKKGIEITTEMKVFVSGKNEVTVKSDKIINLTAPKVHVSGNMSVAGTLKANRLSVSGNVTIGGSLTCGSISGGSITGSSLTLGGGGGASVASVPVREPSSTANNDSVLAANNLTTTGTADANRSNNTGWSGVDYEVSEVEYTPTVDRTVISNPAGNFTAGTNESPGQFATTIKQLHENWLNSPEGIANTAAKEVVISTMTNAVSTGNYVDLKDTFANVTSDVKTTSTALVAEMVMAFKSGEDTLS